MLDSKEVQLAPSMDFGNVIRIIVILVLIIVAAYFLTKYISKRSLRQGMKDRPRRSRWSASSQQRTKPEFGHMVSVVDRIPVDRDKTLMVVEFEGSYYLIGTTPEGFHRIDQVEITEKPEPEAEAEEPQAAASAEERPPDEGTFGQRFRKAFGIVLRSYLPKGLAGRNEAASSFDEQLKARIHADGGKQNPDSGSADGSE